MLTVLKIKISRKLQIDLRIKLLKIRSVLKLLFVWKECLAVN
jgi:hypothetical protein